MLGAAFRYDIGLPDGSAMMVTVHPSYLLRIDGAAREVQEALFSRDLAQMAGHLACNAG